MAKKQLYYWCLYGLVSITQSNVQASEFKQNELILKEPITIESLEKAKGRIKQLLDAYEQRDIDKL